MIVGIFGQKKSIILTNKALNFLLVPRRRLELLHLAATASKTVMSTIPSPGQVLLCKTVLSTEILELRME